MRPSPVVFRWLEVDVIDGDGVAHRQMAMVAHPRYASICKRQFHAGEEYPLTILEERSRASHNQFFAALQEGFDNLPESIQARWPTADHMRKWMLIETGWFDEKEFDFEGRSAERKAKMLGAFIRTEDAYARISTIAIDGGYRVIIRRAKSQSMPEMRTKAEFEASKKAVLDLLESFTNVPRGTLMREAGKSA